MSPACAERTEFLVNMLDKMADGLFDLLERKILKVSDDFKGDLKTYLNGKKNDESEPSGWEIIYDQAKTSENYQNLDRHNQ